MAFTVTLRKSSNTQAMGAVGDLAIAVYDVSVLAADAYPAGGHPVSFATEFREAHFVGPTNVTDGGGPGAAIGWASVFERDSVNTGRIRILNGALAGAALAEWAGATWPIGGPYAFQITVIGRPATDAS